VGLHAILSVEQEASSSPATGAKLLWSLTNESLHNNNKKSVFLKKQIARKIFAAYKQGMTNWNFINKQRVRAGRFASTDTDGFNGAFGFAFPGEARRVCVIASDGLGWQHVSVSFGPNHSTPSYAIMEKVKQIFWGDDCWVMQFHPPASEYVNNHPGCLHLWRPTDQPFPTPDSILTGIKEIGVLT